MVRRRHSNAPPPVSSGNDIYFYGCLSGRPSLLPAPRIPRLATGSWSGTRHASTADIRLTSPRPSWPELPDVPAEGQGSTVRSPRALQLLTKATCGRDYLWKRRYR